jgi:hypothetical protein
MAADAPFAVQTRAGAVGIGQRRLAPGRQQEGEEDASQNASRQ